MRNPGLEEAQVGIKIARRNVNKLSNADDTTFMAESEEELRRLSAEELMVLNCGVGEDSSESLGLQGDPTSPF